jgi:hypothetical protein
MWYLDNIYIMCRIYNCNRIGGVMVDRVKSKTMKLVFVVSPLLKHAALKRKSKDWLSDDNSSPGLKARWAKNEWVIVF